MTKNMTLATQIIVIRHGETTWNLDGRFQGYGDSPLTEKGVAQAQAVGKRMKKVPFDLLYSSDLTRAHRTAHCIATETHHEIMLDPRLRERNLGIFQGKTRAEFSAAYPDIFAAYQADLLDYVIPEGESFRQCYQRCIACFEEIAQQCRQNGGDGDTWRDFGKLVETHFKNSVGSPAQLSRLECQFKYFQLFPSRLVIRTVGRFLP
jgi:broad specificity phosphatase PhoE